MISQPEDHNTEGKYEEPDTNNNNNNNNNKRIWNSFLVGSKLYWQHPPCCTVSMPMNITQINPF